MSYPTIPVAIDNAVTTLGANYTAESGSMIVATGTGSLFGTPSSTNPVDVYVINGTTVSIYSITAVSGDTLTVTFVSGTDTNFPSGSSVSCNAGAPYFNTIRSYVTQLQGDSTNASNLTSGTVPTAMLASGTASSTTFLRGDQTWSSGVSGPQGPQGNQGIGGAAGAQGQQGPQGFQGATGSQGQQGSQGATGTGSQGPQGSAGTNGAQGPQGFQGVTGSGTAAGSSGQLQYNSSGSFAGAQGITYATSGTNLKITPQHTGDVGLGVQGITSQTANAFEVRNASGGLGTSIDAYGNLTVNGTSGTFNETTSTIGISMGLADSARVLFANGTSSQNWQIDNYGGTFRWFTPGVTRMSLNGAGDGLTVVNTITVDAGSGQTANLQNWNNNSGTTLASVGIAGDIATGAGLTVHDKVGIGTTSPSVGLHQAGGCYHLEAIIPPTPTITQVGTTGSAQWYYWIVVKDRAGNYTGLSNEATTTTSNATLSTSNYNVIHFAKVDGAYEYFVIRSSSDGLDPGWYIGNNAMIGSVLDDGSSTYSLNDQISGDPYIFSGPIATTNQTANAAIDGSLTLGAGNDATTLTINATNVNQYNYDAFQVNGTSGSQAGIDQNAQIRTALTTGMPPSDGLNAGAMAYDPTTAFLWIFTGGGWIALEPPTTGAANNPPDLSTFTAYGYAMAVTGQSFAYTDEISPGCTYVEYTSLNAGAHQPAAWVIDIPSGSSRWSAIAQVQGNVGPGWAASFGLCMLESSTGKMVTWGPLYNYGTYACNSWALTCNTPGSGVGGSFGSTPFNTTQTYEMQWLKLVYNTDNSSTQVEAYISCDGRNFTHVTSLGFSGNFTTAPDKVGLGGDVYVGFSNDSANRGGWNVFNWSFTSSL